MRQIKILFVEDQELVIKALLRWFDTFKNVSVVLAKTNAEARQRFAEHSAIDLIIMDGNLPDGTTLDLIKEIRFSKGFTGEIWGCSAEAEIFLRNMQEMGCNRIFPKDNPMKLVNAVRTMAADFTTLSTN